MGALTGSMTPTAYYVEGDLPDDFRNVFTKALGSRKFREIEVESDQDESLGWVDVSDPFDTEFMIERVVWNDYVLFALRQDQLRIPPAVFRLHFRRALTDYLDSQDRERATRAEEEEVRDMLEKQLRRRVLPSIRIFEVAWNLDRGEVWLFTPNKRVNEIFLDLFSDTFGMVLIPRNAYSRLERAGLDQEALDRISALEPTAFAVPPQHG